MAARILVVEDEPALAELVARFGADILDAGGALEKAGFSDVYNVLDGFEGPLDDAHHRGSVSGWRMEGLPWEQL